MRFFGESLVLNGVMEDEATTSIGADIAELSEGETPEAHPAQEPGPDSEEEDIVQEQEEEYEEKAEEVEKTKDLHPFERPSIKQINEEFPDLFKKFPSLRDMYFREAEFSKIFPTIDDAKEVFENNEAFTNIREDVFSGDGSKFLAAIKEVDEKGLERFGANVLPALVKTHPAAFWRAANPLVEDIARKMFIKGTRDKNEDLQNAARYLSDFFFDDVSIAEGKKTTVIEEKPSEVSEERKQFDNERLTAFQGTVKESSRIEILKLIDSMDSKSGKSRLDPDGLFSPFIRSTIIDSIVKELGVQLDADKDHIKFMNSLWDRAKRNGRTEEDKTRIVSAYLARAKSLVPSLRSKYVSEAMGTKIRASEHRREKVSDIENRRNSGSSGKVSGQRSGDYNPKSINYGKTSDEDILNDRITYKN